MQKAYYEELIKILKKNRLSKQDILKLKMKLCKKHHIKKIPTNIQILLNTNEKEPDKLNLITKPTRTISGVSVVAIMSAPFKCPHGKCHMCPSNTKKGIPQSYTGKEPATMRAIRNNFDSYLQIFNRLEQYVVLGHEFDKIELIIMGGTFPSYQKNYQIDFVKFAFKAMNDFSRLFFRNNVFNFIKFKKFFELPCDIYDIKRTKSIQKKIIELKKDCKLIDEQRKNENSKIRCVGLTIETRPDYGMKKHGYDMLALGTTRVELGVQSVYDQALKNINRGHTVNDSIKSIKILKDLGFKLNFHYMPGLPGIDRKKDLEGMKKLFSDQNFRPDMLKLYPCMVIPDTKLFDEYKKGKFNPITTKDAISLIKEFKNYVQPYTRIMRVQRDIPTYMTAAGVDKTNLRQLIDIEGHNCNCIRCREAGHVMNKTSKIPKNIKIKVIKYDASDGKEFFISAEDFTQNILIGFCRLRFPGSFLHKEITKKSAIIRELHVYGQAVKIGNVGNVGNVQHKGWGKKLLKKAEEISIKNDMDKMIIISGVGVRNYYRKFGYRLQGIYMVKKL